MQKQEQKADAEVVVPASTEGVSKKVKLDLEVDTSVKDLGPQSYAKIIHGKSCRQLENFSKIIFDSLHYIALQMCDLVHELSRSYNGAIRLN